MGLLTILFVLLVPVAVFALWVASLKGDKSRDALYKLHLFRNGFAHLFFSTDRKFPKVRPSPSDVTVESSKTIIFVRHAESAWNLVFNKGFIKKDFPARLGNAFRSEANFFASKDSVFLDSPLSEEGASQALGLQKYVTSELIPQLDSTSSVIVASNLRRALSTAAIGFWERLKQTKEKLRILSSLQEVTFNFDGLSLAKEGCAPVLSSDELKALGHEGEAHLFESDNYFDCLENKGNKLVSSKGHHRLIDFAQWCFDDKQDRFDTIIAVGHSLYFRYFFRYFLDADEDHPAKKGKMFNCAVVRFELQKGTTPDGLPWFRIPQDSVEELYLGFDTKDKNKKNQ